MKLGQRGIAEWIVLAILAIAVPATLYLVQTTQVFKSRAYDPNQLGPWAYFSTPTPSGPTVPLGAFVPVHAQAISGRNGLEKLQVWIIQSGADLLAVGSASQWAKIGENGCSNTPPGRTCDLNFMWNVLPLPQGSNAWIIAVVATTPGVNRQGGQYSCSGNPAGIDSAGQANNWYPCDPINHGDHETYGVTIGPPPTLRPPSPTIQPTIGQGFPSCRTSCNPDPTCTSPFQSGCFPDQFQCNNNCRPTSIPTPAPPAPFTLNSPVVSCDGINPKVALTWSQSNNLIYYIVGRIKQGNTAYDATSSQLLPSVTSYTDTAGLLNSTGYTYRVIAGNSSSQTLSNDQFIQTPNCVGPSPTPTNTPIPTPTQTLIPSPTTVGPSPTSSACTPTNGDTRPTNGVVDRIDFNIWRNEFNQELVGIQSAKRADFNCDGRVTLIDFNIWRTTYISGGAR